MNKIQMLTATLFAEYKYTGEQMWIETLLATNKCVRNELYADEEISGEQRKQFQAMRKDAKAKKFDKVVEKDVSRLTRNIVYLL